MRDALTAAEIDQLKRLSEGGDRPGRRIALADPLFDAVSCAGLSNRIAQIWPNAHPVRLVCFNKTAEANWGVPWHQDRVIAVRDRADVDGYRNWSQKGAYWHCEPPEDVLRHMLFLRVHLDASTAQGGAMEIALGSHQAGLVAAAQAKKTAARYPVEVTTAEPGDVLVLNMLVLHRSARAAQTSQRRVLRVDYATQGLPAPLQWAV